MEPIKTKIEKTLKLKKFKDFNLSFLAGDASDRKYFELFYGKNKEVVMYDMDKSNLKSFIKITNILKNDVSVPSIIKNYEKENLLILENFGPQKYGVVLQKETKSKLYKLAVEAIINIQKIKNVNLPEYSIKKFLDESNLFFKWYLAFIEKKKGRDFISEFNFIFSSLLEYLKELPQVLVHRDYHIDNLFYLPKRKGALKCGLIDYQDAIIGPCVYDLVSLTQDARIDVSRNLESTLVNYYLSLNLKINQKLFFYCYNLLAIQRHMKVLGIFCRLSMRDKKPQYIKHLPRVKKLLCRNLKNNEFKKLSLFITPLIENV